MLFTHGETLTLITRSPAGRDADGNQTYTSTETDVAGCPVWPRSSSERVQGQDTVIDGLTTVLPVGTDVSAIDAIRLTGGETYEVDGQPGTYSSPFTGLNPGIVVQLTKVAG
jgi:hypothetical protein